ncbi:hypothetical protein EVAR_52774_1 [Eumeta japonica]|uniref:Uncharacterized protein n=1 Tax=Eumeta variegata TaxID=151549 RepID=A0A4C1XGF5_EUMVA|nr:hypothetical protein EVAR_52774_1 [Eumeta japonica]
MFIDRGRADRRLPRLVNRERGSKEIAACPVALRCGVHPPSFRVFVAKARRRECGDQRHRLFLKGKSRPGMQKPVGVYAKGPTKMPWGSLLVIENELWGSRSVDVNDKRIDVHAGGAAGESDSVYNLVNFCTTGGTRAGGAGETLVETARRARTFGNGQTKLIRHIIFNE